MGDKAHQVIKGVKITPRNAAALRFPQWRESQAFGGWIFSASVQIGYSNAPTEIKMEIVLENEGEDLNSLTPKDFDIKDEYLKCGAGVGGVENEAVFDISLGGKTFTDFILHDYALNLTPEQKTLSVVFKDYSVILDKIYVGLLKRHGGKYYSVDNIMGTFPVACPTCDFNIIIENGTIYRDIAFASYVGINGSVYNNLTSNNLYSAWTNLGETVLSPTFDLNGGYLILGTEEMYESKCEEMPNVSYTFKALLNSLIARGFKFSGAFNEGLANNPIYKQTHAGTLREVLNNWASDLGLQFYIDGRTFVGINLNQEINIKALTEIADPKSFLGAAFSNSNIALGTYNESASLANTYRQSVIVSNTNQRRKQQESFSIKNFVKLQPMHPLDFLVPKSDKDIANSFGTSDVQQVIAGLQNRTFDEIDTAMALAKYDEDLRNIYVGQKIRQSHESAWSAGASKIKDGQIDEQRYASALGFEILTKIKDVNAKATVLEAYLGENDKAVTFHPDFYDIYLGYYYQSAHQEIIAFEREAANSMYKYGVLNIGTTPNPPYIQEDINTFKTSNDEYYLERGGLVVQVKNSFEPSASTYYDFSEAPYSNLFPKKAFYPGGFPYDLLYVAQLENEWGTTDEEFKSGIYDPLVPNCDKVFGSTPSLQALNKYDFQEDIPKKQSWDLKLFAPTFYSDLSKIYQKSINEIAELGEDTQDEVNTMLMGLDGKYRKDCKKLHICIIPNTRTHPNIRVTFEKKGYYDAVNTVVANSINKKLEEAQKNVQTQPPIDTCDESPTTQICASVMNCQKADDSASLYVGWPTYYFSSGTQEFLNGTPNQTIPEDYNQGSLGKDARSLTVSVVRNPVKNLDGAGTDGSYFYTQLLDEDLDYRHQSYSSSVKIVYPVCNHPKDYNLEYIGVLNADVSKTLKIPSSLEIYGEPVNTRDNNTTSLKIINQTMPNDIKTLINPESMQPIKYTLMVTGNRVQAISNIADYYRIISSLNSYQSTAPTKTVDFSVIGSPDLLGSLSSYLDPSKGLNSINISIKDQGVETQLSFSSKPPTLPKQESLINSIGPRMALFTI